MKPRIGQKIRLVKPMYSENKGLEGIVTEVFAYDCKITITKDPIGQWRVGNKGFGVSFSRCVVIQNGFAEWFRGHS